MGSKCNVDARDTLSGVASVVRIARSIKSCTTPDQILTSANWLESVRSVKGGLNQDEYFYLRGLIFDKCASLSSDLLTALIDLVKNKEEQ